MKLNLDMDNTSRNDINMNNMTNKINTENKTNSNSKNKKKKKMKKNNSTIKLDEKVNQNNNTNNNPNKAEFYGDTSRNTLSVEIREPEIILKYLENKGKIKKKIFKIPEADEVLKVTFSRLNRVLSLVILLFSFSSLKNRSL